MSIISWLLDLLRAIWRFFKKFWWLIAIILLVIFIWFPGTWAMISAWLSSIWAAVTTFAAAHGWTTVALLAFGALAILDPEAVVSIVEDVANVVGDVAGGVVGGIVSGIGGSSLGGLLLLGAGIWAYFAFFKKDKNEEPSDEQLTSSDPYGYNPNPVLFPNSRDGRN